jgi:hypothetical protein
VSTKEIADITRAIEATLEQAYAQAKPDAFPVLTNAGRIDGEIDDYRDRLPDPWRMDEQLQNRLIKANMALIQKTAVGMGREAQINLARDRAARSCRDYARRFTAKAALLRVREQVSQVLELADRITDLEAATVGDLVQEVVGVEDGQQSVADKFAVMRGENVLFDVLSMPRGGMRLAWMRDGERHETALENMDLLLARLPERHVFENWFDKLAGIILLLAVQRKLANQLASFIERSERYVVELFESWKTPSDEMSSSRLVIKATVAQLMLLAQRTGTGLVGAIDKDVLTELQSVVDRRLKFIQAQAQRRMAQQVEDPKFTLYDMASFRPELEAFLDRQTESVADAGGEELLWNSFDLAAVLPVLNTQAPVGETALLLACCKLVGGLVDALGASYPHDSVLGRAVEKTGSQGGGMQVGLPHPMTEPRFVSLKVGAPASIQLSPRAFVDIGSTKDAATERLTPAEALLATLRVVVPRVLGSIYANTGSRNLLAMLKIANLSRAELEDLPEVARLELCGLIEVWFHLDKNTRLSAIKDGSKLRLVN